MNIHSSFVIPLLLVSVLSLVLGREIAAQDELNFFNSIEKAHESSDESKPMVVYFGASWCAPCRRMHSTTFELLPIDDTVHDYLWVKYDIDDSPDVATRYGVVSVPTIVVLDENQNPVGSNSGFISAERLIEFVADVIENPQVIPPTLEELAQDLADANDSNIEEVLLAIVREVADPMRGDREEIAALVADEHEQSKPVLVDLLEHDELRIRASASSILSRIRGDRLPFDPFADSDKRSRQVDEVRRELSKND